MIFCFCLDTVSKGGLRKNQESMDDPKKRKEQAEQISIKRAGVPEDVANMVLFSCSDDASYCTDTSFFVDGGWMLTHPDV